MRTLFLVLILSVISLSGSAQTESAPVEPPYKRFPTVPPFRLLALDSVTYFNKEHLMRKKAVLMVLFSPDCDHCQKEVEEIIKNISSLKKVQIILSSTYPIKKLREFYVQNGLRRFENIFMGRDESYMLPSFFGVKSMPFLAFYNKKHDLISVFEGNMEGSKLAEELSK